MKVIIYGSPNCGFCQKAKNLCENLSVSYEYKTIGVEITRSQVTEMIGEEFQTVPQIFISEEGLIQHIGGYTELLDRMS